MSAWIELISDEDAYGDVRDALAARVILDNGLWAQRHVFVICHNHLTARRLSVLRNQSVRHSLGRM